MTEKESLKESLVGSFPWLSEELAEEICSKLTVKLIEQLKQELSDANQLAMKREAKYILELSPKKRQEALQKLVDNL